MNTNEIAKLEEFMGSMDDGVKDLFLDKILPATGIAKITTDLISYAKSSGPLSGGNVNKRLLDEFKTKLDEYRADPIYQYLKAEGYGTPEYKKRGLGRYMDNLFAKWCHFQENFAQESLLREATSRLQKMK